MKRSVIVILYSSLFLLFIVTASSCCLPAGAPSVQEKSAAPSATPGSSSSGSSSTGNKTNSWEYSEDEDEMGRGKIKHATTISSNTVDFSFPYQGEQHATLTLRSHPKYGNDVILRLDKGQFMTGVYGCRVTVRFDEGKAISLSGTEAADLKTNVLFIRGFPQILAGIRHAKTMRIEAPFYQEGNRVFEFDVTGLEWQDSGSGKKK